MMTNPNQVIVAPEVSVFQVQPECPTELSNAIMRFDSCYHGSCWFYAATDIVRRAMAAENTVDRLMALASHPAPLTYQSDVWELCHENIQSRRPV